MSQSDPVSTVETTWNIQLKKVSGAEYRSMDGCPFCGDGGKGDKSDRFRVLTDGSPRWWCRKCDSRGFIDTLLKSNPLTEEQRRLARIELDLRHTQRKQAEQEIRLTALERLAKNQDHLRYHHYLEKNPMLMDYWLEEGITAESIKRYQLGYCSSCPTYRDSPSHTIPFINRGQLVNIRHRLIRPNGSGKYRPHAAGLGSALFNVDLLDQAKGRVVIVEGSKKSIVTAQAGFSNVGISGKRTFHREWLPWFAHVGEIIVALDPDAMQSAFRLAAMFDKRARVAALPAKIDDMITMYGASPSDIEGFFACARPVQ